MGSMARHRLTTFRFLFVGLSICLNAYAQAPTNTAGVRLSWVRGEDATTCLGLLALERDVTRRLGYNPFGGEARQWIDGFVTASSSGFRAQLFERDANGTTLGRRTLEDESADCRHISDAVSLAIALIIDPLARLRSLDAAPTSEEMSQHTPQQLPESQVVDPNVTSQPCPVLKPMGTITIPPTSRETAPNVSPVVNNKSALVWIAPGFRQGLFPALSPSVEFTVDVKSHHVLPLEYRLGMVYLPERKVAHTNATLSYGLTAGLFDLCLVTAGTLSGFFCTGFEGGALHTVVHDPDPYQPGDRLWFAGRFEAGSEWNVIGPFSLQLRLIGTVPFTRWVFRVRQNEVPHELYSQPFFQPGLAIGFGMRFF
jgi:hypothetical protein